MGIRRNVARLFASAALLGTGVAAFADPVEHITDGSFEAGSPAWTFANAFRCSDSICGLPAAEGSFYGSNGFDFELVPALVSSWSLGAFQQSVPVPQSPATLAFSVRRVASGDAVSTYLWVTLDGTWLDQIDTELPTFERVSIELPESFVGFGSRVLRFEIFCENAAQIPLECDRFDVDDVSLRTPEPEAGALGLVATGMLAWIDRRRPRARPL